MECNQFRCPGDDLPKNGETERDTALEEQPYNTGSYDRDCTLTPWTAVGPRSVAGGGGIQECVHRVGISVRANGRCPQTPAPRPPPDAGV